MVFGVSIDSPSKVQVNMGKIIKPADEPINLAVQADPVSSTMNLQAYQNATEVGTPKTKAAVQGLSLHHSAMY